MIPQETLWAFDGLVGACLPLDRLGALSSSNGQAIDLRHRE